MLLCYEVNALMGTCMLGHCGCVRLFCDLTDGSPPGSSVRGILQAKILEWVAMPSSRGSSQPRDQTHMSLIPPALAGRFFMTSTPGKPLGVVKGKSKVEVPVLLSEIFLTLP